MVSFLMIGSFAFGLIALILPIVNIISSKKNDSKSWAIYSIVSMSLSATAICFQVLYSSYMVKLEAWSSLMDTVGTSALLSVALLLSTIILNVISLYIYKRDK